MKIVTTNKTAYHNYEILESFEAGISLVGSEVKAIREGRISLKEMLRRGKGRQHRPGQVPHQPL